MTLTVVIVPKFVNPPKGNQTSGSIKTADGAYYNVPPAMLNQFQPNNSYTVEYTEKAGTGQWAGKTFRSITKIASTEAAPPQANTGGGGGYGAHDAATKENIFVCGAINNAIRGDQLSINDRDALKLALENLHWAWGMTYGRKAAAAQAKPVETAKTEPKPTLAEDLEDEVPF